MSRNDAAQKWPSLSSITDVSTGPVRGVKPGPQANPALNPLPSFTPEASGQPMPGFSTDVDKAGNTSGPRNSGGKGVSAGTVAKMANVSRR
jgi:hypothetical protein